MTPEQLKACDALMKQQANDKKWTKIGNEKKKKNSLINRLMDHVSGDRAQATNFANLSHSNTTRLMVMARDMEQTQSKRRGFPPTTDAVPVVTTDLTSRTAVVPTEAMVAPGRKFQKRKRVTPEDAAVVQQQNTEVFCDTDVQNVTAI